MKGASLLTVVLISWQVDIQINGIAALNRQKVSCILHTTYTCSGKILWSLQDYLWWPEMYWSDPAFPSVTCRCFSLWQQTTPPHSCSQGDPLEPPSEPPSNCHSDDLQWCDSGMVALRREDEQTEGRFVRIWKQITNASSCKCTTLYVIFLFFWCLIWI